MSLCQEYGSVESIAVFLWLIKGANLGTDLGIAIYSYPISHYL